MSVGDAVNTAFPLNEGWIVSRHTACIPTAIQLIHHGPELWTDWLTPRTDAQAALSVLEGRGAQNKRITLSSQRDEPRRAAQGSGVDGQLRLVDQPTRRSTDYYWMSDRKRWLPNDHAKSLLETIFAADSFPTCALRPLTDSVLRGLVLRQVPVGVHADSQCGHSWHDN